LVHFGRALELARSTQERHEEIRALNGIAAATR